MYLLSLQNVSFFFCSRPKIVRQRIGSEYCISCLSVQRTPTVITHVLLTWKIKINHWYLYNYSDCISREGDDCEGDDPVYNPTLGRIMIIKLNHD